MHGYRSQLYEQLGNRPRQHFSQKNKLYTIPTSNLARACKNKKKREARRTRWIKSSPRERSSSTKIFLQSLTRARVREKQEDPPHLERSVLKIGTLHLGSRTERTPKAKIKSCPFSIFMIDTSFTLFFLRKTTQKIAIFEKKKFAKNR